MTSRKGKKLHAEHAATASCNISNPKTRTLDQISSPKSLFHSETKPGSGTNSEDLKSDPVQVFGFEMTSHVNIHCTELILIQSLDLT